MNDNSYHKSISCTSQCKVDKPIPQNSELLLFYLFLTFLFSRKESGCLFLRYDTSSFSLCWICWKCNILSLGHRRGFLHALMKLLMDLFLYMSAVLPRLCLWCWWVSCMGNTAKLSSWIRDRSSKLEVSSMQLMTGEK